MLLNRSNGFGVGPSINPCTKGIWIWNKSIPGTGEDGKPINILVMDTEGIGAIDEDTAHDSKIFALSILLSSIFIFCIIKYEHEGRRATSPFLLI